MTPAHTDAGQMPPRGLERGLWAAHPVVFPSALLCCAWVTMIVLARPTGDFPINDDWMFARAVLSVLEHGRYEVASFAAPNVGPQVYWGALFCLPFGFSFDALRASTLVLGLVGCLALYALFIEVWRDRILAFVAACSLMVNPIYFGLACTFMTDVPALALTLVAMVLILRGMRLDRDAVVLAGLSVAWTALMIRQFAAVVLVGYLCARIARDGVRARTLWRASWPLLVGAAMHVAFARWQQATGRKPAPSGIPDITPWSVFDLSSTAALTLFDILQYVGLFVTPLLVLVLVGSPRSILRATGRRQIAWSAGLLGAFTVAAVLLYVRLPMPTGGDVMTFYGVGPWSPGDAYHDGKLPVLSGAMKLGWRVATGVALIASAVWSAGVTLHGMPLWRPWHAGRSFRGASRSLLFLSTAAAYLLLILLIGTRHPVFDRYFLLPIVLGTLATPLVTLRTVPRQSGRAAVACALLPLAVAATFSVLATYDYFRWGALHWEALRELTGPRGIAASRIDGGMEFGGWTQYDPLYVAGDTKSWWWVQDDEYIVGGGPVPGYRVIFSRPFHRVLTQQDEAIVVLQRQP